jgi:1,4-alpha-glucan branching enzyme
LPTDGIPFLTKWLWHDHQRDNFSVFAPVRVKLGASMILTQEEAASLNELRHRSPHELLGMHVLGDGSGVVARALQPEAVAVEIEPVHEKGKPSFGLRPVGQGLFEGITTAAKSVYAYDLIITYPDGSKWRTRDPYSFLPCLGETDLYLFAQGNERRIYDKLGSHLRALDGVPGTSFAV